MIYDIDLSKLEKFKEKLDFEFYVSHEKVLNILSNIGSDDLENTREDQIHGKIANYMFNRDSIVMNIDLENNDWFTDENKCKYIACIISEQKTVKVNLKSNINLANSELGLILKSDVDYEEIEDTKVDWTIDEQLLVAKWGNPEYILKNINTGNIIENLDLIDKSFWNDENTRKVFDIVSNSYSYRAIHKEILEKNKDNRSIIKEIKPKDIFLFLSITKEYEKYIKSNKKINKEMEEIEEKINNIEYVRAIVRENDVFDVYEKYIKQETLYSIDILAYIFKDSTFKTFQPYRDGTKYSKILKKHSKEFKEELFFKILDPEQKNEHCYPQVSFLINDIYSSNIKEIKNFIEKIKKLKIENVKEYITSAIISNQKKSNIEDKELLEIILDLHPTSFLQCKKLHNEENIDLFLAKYNKKNEIYLSPEVLKGIKKKETILKLIPVTSNETVLKIFGQSALEDKSILTIMLDKHDHFFWNKKDTKDALKIIENDQELLSKYIENCNTNDLSNKTKSTKFYVTEMYRREMERGIQRISKLSDIIVDKKIITKDLYISLKEVTKGKFIEQIPEALFDDIDFSKRTLKLYEDGIITSESLLPTNIKKFISSFDVKGNYVEKFDDFILFNKLRNSNKTKVRKLKI